MTVKPVTEAEIAALPLPDSSFLKNYITYASCCTDAHSAYHAIVGLALLTQTIPVDYAFPYGQPLYANLYSLCVGESTESRKSQAITIGRRILDDGVPGSVGEQPGSKEQLIDSLRNAPRQLVAYGEFGSFLAQAEKGYMMPLKTTYTEAWDGTPLGRATLAKKRAGETGEAKTPRLTLACGSTLEFLERHTEPSDWTGGFMSRFLTIYADRERTFDVPEGLANGHSQLASWLQQLNGWSQFGVPIGKCVGFDPQARERWRNWYAKLCREAAASEVKGAIARSHAQALKIAMLLAWDFGPGRGAQDWLMPLYVLEPALAITDLHVRSMQRIGQGLASSRDMRERRQVLKAIPQKGKPLGQIIRDSKLLRRRAIEIIETLIEEGVVCSANGIENGTGTAGGAWYRLTTAEEIADRFSAKPVSRDFVVGAPVFTPEGDGAKVIPLNRQSTVNSGTSIPTSSSSIPEFTVEPVGMTTGGAVPFFRASASANTSGGMQSNGVVPGRLGYGEGGGAHDDVFTVDD